MFGPEKPWNSEGWREDFDGMCRVVSRIHRYRKWEGRKDRFWKMWTKVVRFFKR